MNDEKKVKIKGKKDLSTAESKPRQPDNQGKGSDATVQKLHERLFVYWKLQ